MKRSKRTWNQSFGARVLLLFFSTFGTLLILELCFRLAGLRGDYHVPRYDQVVPKEPGQSSEEVPYGFIPNSIVVSHYDADPRGYFDDPCSAFDGAFCIRHAHNSVGWRDNEHRLEKPEDVFRILGLGDSYLWGQGVKREDICLSKIAELLDGAIPGRSVETINSGRSAANTTYQRDLLRNAGLAYHPDLVIVHFVLNDVEEDVFREGPKVEFYYHYPSIYQVSDSLSNYSYLWSWGRQRYLKYVRGAEYIQQCVDSFSPQNSGWLQCQEALRDIKTMCEANDVALLVVVFPFFHNLDGDYPFQQIHGIVREYCQAEQIPVLDLRNEYREYRGPELWVHPFDQHPNEKAHDIAARAIAEYLKKHAQELLVPRDS